MSEPCTHPGMPLPDFDLEEAAKKLDAEGNQLLAVAEIRKRWPRGLFVCMQCGASIITYASYEHYIYGDW